jgi:hypothetical protein
MFCKWCKLEFHSLTSEDPIILVVGAKGFDQYSRIINKKMEFKLCPDCFEHLWQLLEREIK